jgi:hypothetical protein
MTMVAAAVLVIAVFFVLHHTGVFSSLLDRAVGHRNEVDDATEDTEQDQQGRTPGIHGWPGFGPSFYGEELPPDPPSDDQTPVEM